jgi:hypothetical protein
MTSWSAARSVVFERQSATTALGSSLVPSSGTGLMLT